MPDIEEVTRLRDALKRFDAWIPSTFGGKDGTIAVDLVLLANFVRQFVVSHDKDVVSVAEAKAARDKEEEEAAKAAVAKRIADDAAAADKAKADTEAKAAAAKQADAKRAAAAKADADRRDDAPTPDFRRRDDDQT